jgi:hypothetical protein
MDYRTMDYRTMDYRTMDYKTVSLAERFDLFEEQDRLGGEPWPEFLCHDPVAIEHWMDLIEVFKKYQLMIMADEEILAVINTVPLNFKENIKLLPDGGVDWGIKKAIFDHHSGTSPNMLMAVQIVVNKRHLGKGLSKISTQEVCKLAKINGLSDVVVPVRPNNKHEYPLIDIEDYVTWKNDKGLPFDNWLRVHVQAGGKIIRVCPKSMFIPGTIDEWKEWTGLEFPGTGKYIVKGALNSVSIDLDNNLGTYIEPNIWVVHNIDRITISSN